MVAKFTDWLIVPVAWRKPTWLACGTLGLPLVKRLPLPATPAEPLKVHAVLVGSYWKAAAFVPKIGYSNPGSRMLAGVPYKLFMR